MGSGGRGVPSLECFNHQLMSWEKWKESIQKLLQATFMSEPFYIITLSLLGLIIPLSFLLLAKLANSHYILSFKPPSSPPFFSSFPLSFLYFSPSNPTLLHLLLLFISFTALLQALMGGFAFLPHDNTNNTKPTTISKSKAYLYAAWTLLCTFNICVVLGIERTIAAGFWPLELAGSSSGRSTNLMNRVMFFIGLHETMLHWSRVTVRPVVDDTMSRVERKERWVERVAMAASFGGLWWCDLRKEVETMVVILELKRKLSMKLEFADLINGWLHYVTITIAMVRLYWTLVWLAKSILCISLRRNSSPSYGSNDDGKV